MYFGNSWLQIVCYSLSIPQPALVLVYPYLDLYSDGWLECFVAKDPDRSYEMEAAC
jgi:hypothetical protein